MDTIRRRRALGLAALGFAVIAATACAGPVPATAVPPSPTPTAAPGSAAPSSTIPPTSSVPSAAATPSLSEILPRDAFADPTGIDNPFFPLVPGMQFTSSGAVTVDGERLSHRDVFTVTDLTKVIDGIRAVVVYDVDYTPSNAVAEIELAFFAQSDDGTVWLMGEYPEEYEDGKVIDAPTWLSGIADALAGILMPAAPSLTAPSYAQGWGPAVEFADRARTFELGSKTCVPASCYAGLVVTDEFNASEPDAHQLKYYAPGVGLVRVGYAGALDEAMEVLELTKVARLDAQAMAELRQTCLAMDARARAASHTYALSQPLLEP